MIPVRIGMIWARICRKSSQEKSRTLLGVGKTRGIHWRQREGPIWPTKGPNGAPQNYQKFRGIAGHNLGSLWKPNKTFSKTTYSVKRQRKCQCSWGASEFVENLLGKLSEIESHFPKNSGGATQKCKILNWSKYVGETNISWSGNPHSQILYKHYRLLILWDPFPGKCIQKV